ncbi:G-protein coupled receptor 54 [Trichinella pseudospiralis]|uniref:G-protein coupled receptor 54 n=1 Tax=Trichinella pseudospiralis TaxID=6337 RepID=A0A0V1FEY5_TRIPS|nr:G-protein coupled receptor 54 [Trichinella pseudospiralis]
MACLVVADADYDQLEITNASECNCSDPAYWYNELCDCDYPEATSIALLSKMRSFTNILLASMSTADLLILLFCLPVQYCKYLSHSWIMGAFLCVAFHYVELMTMICSLMTMTTISIQRYAAVAFPMKSMSFRSKKRALKTVLVTWLLSALLAVPILFGQELEVYKTPKNVTVSWCWRRFSDHYWEKIFVLYQFVILYLGPFATTAISYLLLIQRLYFGEANSLLQENVSARSVGNANGSTAEHQQTYQAKSSRRFCPRREQSKKVTKMLVIILLLFFVCWTPTLVDEFLVAFDYLCHTSPTTTLKYMRMIFAIMKFSNSCINPIVYAFMSNSFRTTFIIVCNPLCLKRRHSLPVDSRTHNRRDSPISERSLRLHSDIRPTELLDGAQSVFRKQRLMKVKYAKN